MNMGLPVERVRPGMFVAIHRCVDDNEPDQTEMTPWGPRTVRSSSTYTGTPLRVLAVSPPFVCVTNGEETEAIDLRRIGIIKLRKSYVKAFCGPERFGRLLSEGKTKAACREDQERERPQRCP